MAYRVKLRQRVKSRLDWIIEKDEPLLWLARNLALLWMNRELQHKGKVKGGPLNKGCGILVEEIFSAMLIEMDVPHIRTLPILDKSHNVNKGKAFDFKVGNLTIDIKAIPPCATHGNINVNACEVDKGEWCNLYIAYKCEGNFTERELGEMRTLDDDLTHLYTSGKRAEAEFKEKIVKLRSYMEKINKVNLVGWCNKGDFAYQPKGKYGPYYYAKPNCSLSELAEKLAIPIEMLERMQTDLA
jgi:hypothetical protein